MLFTKIPVRVQLMHEIVVSPDQLTNRSKSKDKNNIDNR